METAVDTNPAPQVAEVNTSNPSNDIKVTSSSDVAPKQTWTESLDPDLKEYVSSKGFSDPKSVIESYRNLEKLRGVPQDRLLKLPEQADAPEWNDVYTKLGKPSTADEYGIEVDPQRPEFGNWAKETFHGLNLTKDQATSLTQKYNSFLESQSGQMVEKQNADYLKSEANLKKEWGAAFDQNLGAAQRAGRALGITLEMSDAIANAIGLEGTMKFMHSLGERLGEASYHDGKSESFSNKIHTPDQAMARIQNLKKDKDWTARYLKGGTKEGEEMENLLRMANPAD